MGSSDAARAEADPQRAVAGHGAARTASSRVSGWVVASISATSATSAPSAGQHRWRPAR